MRAKLGKEIHATDASPTGAGSCIAKRFKSQVAEEDTSNVCIACRRDIGEPGEWDQPLPMAMWIKTLLLGLLAESSQILPLFRAKGSDK